LKFDVNCVKERNKKYDNFFRSLKMVFEASKESSRLNVSEIKEELMKRNVNSESLKADMVDRVDRAIRGEHTEERGFVHPDRQRYVPRDHGRNYLCFN
jgi:hypothetical protein